LGDLNPDRGEVPFMEEQFSIKVLESANPIYTVLRGVCISEAISLRWAVKKFDLFVVGVARGDKPPEGAVFLYNASAHISYGGTYGH
jgi:hypothetical protein